MLLEEEDREQGTGKTYQLGSWVRLGIIIIIVGGRGKTQLASCKYLFPEPRNRTHFTPLSSNVRCSKVNIKNIAICLICENLVTSFPRYSVFVLGWGHLITYSRTSSNGHLAAMDNFFWLGVWFIHLLKFQPLYNGHLSATLLQRQRPLKYVSTAKINLWTAASLQPGLTVTVE